MELITVSGCAAFNSAALLADTVSLPPWLPMLRDVSVFDSLEIETSFEPELLPLEHPMRIARHDAAAIDRRGNDLFVFIDFVLSFGV